MLCYVSVLFQVYVWMYLGIIDELLYIHFDWITHFCNNYNF